MSRTAAPLAVARWAWRLFRKELRQQALIFALLTVAVAAAVALSSIAYNTAPTGRDDFGSANGRFVLRGDDPQLASNLSAARSTFGITEEIWHEYDPIPGSVMTLDLRAQDSYGPFSSSLILLRSGALPHSASEVALTRRAAMLYDVEVGGTVRLAGVDERVVGIVENPRKLSDMFALYAPGSFQQADSVSLLVHSTSEKMREFQRGHDGIQSRSEPEEDVAARSATGVLALTTIVMLLVALVASASFTAIGHRRLRQLGMFAVTGATPRHIRLVMIFNGAILGVAAGISGVVLGMIGFAVAAPFLESSANHRISSLDVPLWVLIAVVVLSTATATAAAWWPARMLSKLSIMMALRARSPQPKAAHRSALFGLILCAAGITALANADIGVVHHSRNDTRPYLVVFGVLANVVGVLLSSPLLVRLLGRIGSRAPIGMRIAFRDLSRYQARSAAAVASIALALGVSMAIIVVSATQSVGADSGNLSGKQMLIQFRGNGPMISVATPEQVNDMQTSIDRLTKSWPDGVVTPLEAVLAPDEVSKGSGFIGPDSETVGVTSKVTLTVGRAVDKGSFTDAGNIVVATPEVARRFGLDLSNTSVDFFTVPTGDLYLMGANVKRGQEPQKLADSQRTVLSAMSKYTSLPQVFMTPAAVQRMGLKTQTLGWLVDSASTVTDSQLKDFRDLARSNGLTIETRDNQHSLAELRMGASAAGLLLALGILAMTVGLIRAEGARDARLLVATGAPRSVRRTINATTAATLALGGVVLGVVMAYAGLMAAYAHRLHILRSHIPVEYLLVEVVGVPLIAALCGWLLVSRQSETLGRTVLDS